eukprot:4024053-Lingulodinium_polyedra.AAC.1
MEGASLRPPPSRTWASSLTQDQAGGRRSMLAAPAKRPRDWGGLRNCRCLLRCDATRARPLAPPRARTGPLAG